MSARPQKLRNSLEVIDIIGNMKLTTYLILRYPKKIEVDKTTPKKEIGFLSEGSPIIMDLLPHSHDLSSTKASHEGATTHLDVGRFPNGIVATVDL